MKPIVTEGKCVFCNKTFAKTGLARHLNNHLTELVKSNKPGKSYLIRITTDKRWGATPYFLYLWVNGNAEMDDIDIFLRQIWLECCGHMSSFSRKKVQRTKSFPWGNLLNADDSTIESMLKAITQSPEHADPEVEMDNKVKDVLKKGLELDYSYDFGSTTQLLLTVLEEYPVKANEEIVLLSRNERPELLCDICNAKPATLVCGHCMGYNNEYAFCKTCAKKHSKRCDEFADYSSLPVVNSPRMGVCAYEGGGVDKERD